MIYRKHGSVARWENGTLIRVTESGEAIEDGDYFECRPMRSAATPVAALCARVEATAAAITAATGGGRLKSGGPLSRRPPGVAALHIERLIITHGIADHECEGKTWREETDRIHASLIHNSLRALVDSTTRRLDDLFLIADALQRAEPTERAIDKVRLAPNVTAALLPHLAGRTPPNVRLIQTKGGVDGYGNEILEAETDWPNAYRPSYRIRPVRTPLDLRLECDDTHVDEDAPRAIALLAPVTGLRLRVLVEDARRVFPATITVTAIRAVSNDRVWYPYGGGSFGAALML